MLVGKISQKELTRVTVERGRIKKVTGNAGEFLLERTRTRDKSTSAPRWQAPPNRSICSSRRSGRLTLLLQPVDLPPDHRDQG